MEYPDFDGIREFILAAQLQSFTAAAYQLGLTNSAVGKIVSRLEQRLGIKLLHRTTRKLTLTREGEAYLSSCLRAAQDLQDTELSLSTSIEAPRGQLRIDLPAAFGRRHVAPVLYALARQHAQLDLNVTFGERTVDMVAEVVDVAVRIGDLSNDPGLVAHRLGEQQLVIVASPEYLRQHPPIQEKEDLLKHDCVIGWRRTMPPTWRLKGIKDTIQRQEIRVRHELADGEMVLNATIAGCGLSQLATWLVEEHVRAGTLVTVLDQYAGARMPIHVIRQRTRFIQPKVQVAIAAILQLTTSRPDRWLSPCI